MKRYLTIIAFAAAVLSGCNTEIVDVTPDYGSFSLDMSVSSEYNVKAASDEELISSFIVTLSRTDGAGAAQTWTYSEMPSVVELPEGSYTISASSPEGKIAAWDQPLYYGSKEFSVVAKTTTTIELLCSITNVKVTVNCSERFLAELYDFNITVSSANATDSDGFLNWTIDEVNAGREGFFDVAPLTVTVKAYRVADTDKISPINKTFSISEVAARDHHILNFDVNIATGSVNGLNISLNDQLNDVVSDIEIPGLDEIPVDGGDDSGNTGGSGDTGDVDDPGDTPSVAAPSLVWDANPTFATMELAQSMDINLVVNAPGVINDFIVDIESDILSTMLPMLGLTNHLDLINDETAATAMSQLGLPTGDQLKGQTQVDFALSTLVPLIYSLAPASGSEHIFTLTVTDELGQTLEQSLTFVMP